MRCSSSPPAHSQARLSSSAWRQLAGGASWPLRRPQKLFFPIPSRHSLHLLLRAVLQPKACPLPSTAGVVAPMHTSRAKTQQPQRAQAYWLYRWSMVNWWYHWQYTAARRINPFHLYTVVNRYRCMRRLLPSLAAHAMADAAGLHVRPPSTHGPRCCSTRILVHHAGPSQCCCTACARSLSLRTAALHGRASLHPAAWGVLHAACTPASPPLAPRQWWCACT